MSDLDLTKKTNFSQNQNTDSSQNLRTMVAVTTRPSSIGWLMPGPR